MYDDYYIYYGPSHYLTNHYKIVCLISSDRKTGVGVFVDDGVEEIFTKFTEDDIIKYAVDLEEWFNSFLSHPSNHPIKDVIDLYESFMLCMYGTDNEMVDAGWQLYRSPLTDLNSVEDCSCVCNMRELMINGCPSVSGNKCRSRG